ncbi:MAG: SH3 domain-containing protein [Acidobacteriota bacterium]|nr:SH3 domain-containing protein [Acidobacteriota bacterium]
MLRRVLIAVAVVLLVSGGVGAWLWWKASPPAKGEAYVGMAGVPLWDGNGQIRRRVQNLAWGEKLVVLAQYNDSIKVRTPQGKVGWVNEDRLMDPDVWQRLGTLAARVQQMSTQAQGHTAVLSNLRLDPGRTSPRVGQLKPNTPVEILERSAVERSVESARARNTSRLEPWLLVRARISDSEQIAGWTLASFISLDLPDPLPAYATSAGMNPLAYFALSSVKDPEYGEKPYYLVAGSGSGQGQACDFTMLRVYTWSVLKHRYETAFVQNNLCGHLPIQVQRDVDPQHDSLFSFDDNSGSGTQQLSYRMRSTQVRPLRRPSATKSAQNGGSSRGQASRR